MDSYKKTMKDLSDQYRSKNDIYTGLKRAGKFFKTLTIVHTINVSDIFLPPKGQIDLVFL